VPRALRPVHLPSIPLDIEDCISDLLSLVWRDNRLLSVRDTLTRRLTMVRTIWSAAFATVMVLGLSGISSAADQPKGQSSSELNSLGSRSGSPSESGKTGIGSTSGSDASIDNSLKATTQPCPGQGSASMDSTKRSSESRKNAETSSRVSPDPCATSPSSGSQMDRR